MATRLSIAFGAIGSLLINNAAIAQNQTDAVILGNQNTGCTSTYVASSGGWSVTCFIDGLTVIDLKNKVLISCYGSPRPFGIWQQKPKTPWFKLIKQEHFGGCYKEHYDIQIKLDGSRLIQKSQENMINGKPSMGSILWNYDANTQTLSYCLAPIFVGVATEVSCDNVVVQEWP